MPQLAELLDKSLREKTAQIEEKLLKFIGNRQTSKSDFPSENTPVDFDSSERLVLFPANFATL